MGKGAKAPKPDLKTFLKINLDFSKNYFILISMETKPAQVRNLEAEKAEREAEKREEWERELQWRDYCLYAQWRKIEAKWWDIL
jgi:hypothetical protein